MKIGFISDAHGNEGAFISGLNILEKQGCDQIIFLGDSIGYMPNRMVIDIIRKNGLLAILGNHEAMLLSGKLYKNEEIYQLARCHSLLNDSDLEAISNWPPELNISTDGYDIWSMHGGPLDITFGYVYPDSALDIYQRPPKSVTIMGNTHLPFCRQSGNGAIFLNPGSCGLPRDCGHLGSIAILDTSSMKAHILRFDIKEASNCALLASAPVHKSVIELFDRPKPSNLIGAIYEI